MVDIVSKSQFSIQEKMIELAKKYFDIDDATAKIGMFGYVTEACSLIHEEGMVHRCLMSDELFLNTASTPTAISNFAVQENFDIATCAAVPSKASVNLVLNKLDVKNYLTATGQKDFYISRNDYFEIGSYKFSLPYSVILKFNENGTMVALYDVVNETPVNTDIESQYISNPYIKAVTIITNDVKKTEYISLSIDLYQYYITESIFENLDYQKTIDATIQYIVSFQSSFVNFNVSYKDSPIGTYEQIAKLFDTSLTIPNYKFCYYNFIGENEFIIFFNPLSGFTPILGSFIRVETFLTEGSLGNFEYTDSPTFSFSDKEKQKITTYSVLNDKIITGGRDRLTWKEIKDKILNNKITRDNIITDEDVERVFIGLVQKYFNVESTSTVFKKRNDIVSKKITAYMNIVDTSTQMMPSNTADIEIDMEYLRRVFNTLNYGTLIYYDKLEKKYKVLNDEEFSTKMLTDHNFHLYTIPFALRVYPDFSPIPFTSYIQFFLNKSYSGIYKDTETTIIKDFALNEMVVERGILKDNNIRIYMNIALGTIDFDLNKDITVRLFFKRDDILQGFVDLRWMQSKNMFYTEIETDNVIIDGKGLRIKVHNLIDESDYIFVNELNDTELVIYFKSDNQSSSKYNKKYFYSLNGDIDGKEIVTRYDIRNVSLFKYLNKYMNSFMKYNEDKTKLIIRDVPLISANYYYESSKLIEFNTSFINMIDEVDTRLSNFESNTKIDIKLMNNYGISKLSNSIFTNLSIDMTVGVNTKVVAQSVIKESIRRAVAEFIYSINFSDTGFIGLSNIATYIENSVLEVKYVTINKINGLSPFNIQSTPKSDLTLEQQMINTPENINVQSDDINIEIIV